FRVAAARIHPLAACGPGPVGAESPAAGGGPRAGRNRTQPLTPVLKQMALGPRSIAACEATHPIRLEQGSPSPARGPCRAVEGGSQVFKRMTLLSLSVLVFLPALFAPAAFAAESPVPPVPPADPANPPGGTTPT